ncbi:hypothetical protein RhiTH_003359 [Rhizoctonia solani]
MAITYPTREDSSHIHEQSVGLSHAISYLAANGATITTLLVKNRLPQHFAPEALQFWKRLPLTSVHLEMRVPLDNELEAFCALLSSMPLLEDLKLYTSYESFDLSMLKIIVELLPRLRSLRIPVEWKQIITLTEADFALSRSQNANPLHIRSDFYLPDPKQENTERVARFLFSIHPKSPVVCVADRPIFYHYDEGYIDQTPKDMINLELWQLLFQ